jgi:hypothetical protein
MSRTCLVLGGADTLFRDIADYKGPIDGVVACNDAGTVWPHKLDAWATLHPDKWDVWVAKRAEFGHPACETFYCNPGGAIKPAVKRLQAEGKNVHFIGYTFAKTPSGSSGMLALKVALTELNFDRAVLCGIPLTQTAHFFKRDRWNAAGFRRAWKLMPLDIKSRTRSMSGWTREVLGSPDTFA